MAFGDIVKVTPSSKVVGDMALFLVSHNMTIAGLGAPAGRITICTLPNSVVEMFSGSLGEPEGGWPEKLQRSHSARRRADSRAVRASIFAPVDLRARRPRRWRRSSGHRISRTDLMSYLMYPDVFLKFAKARSTYSDVWTCCPRREFFYGMEKGRGSHHRTRARQDADHQVPDGQRAASGRHAHGVLRIERAAARSDGPRQGAEAAGGGAYEGGSCRSPATWARRFPGR